jgi:hypothetical protein
MLEAIRNAILAAENFFISQVSGVHPAWGTEPYTSPCAWTTAQICGILSQDSEAIRFATRKAMAWLEVQQRIDGSWASVAHENASDTPSTATGAIAFIRHFGRKSYVAQQSLDWLFNAYNDGWTTVPGESAPRFNSCHHYSTSYALRALARGPKKTKYSLCLQEGLLALLKSRRTGEGWGFHAISPADPTFTSYVLHGLIDVARISGIPVPADVVASALVWLHSQQNASGSWGDWHGITESAESTAYAVYVTLVSGIAVSHETSVWRAVEWLLSNQTPDGAWYMDVTQKSSKPNNWVTHTVMMALLSADRYLGKNHGAETPPGVSATRLQPIDLDPESYTPQAALEPSESPILADPNNSSLENIVLPQLYEIAIPVPWGELPLCRPYEHTMSEAIDTYVRQKLPCEIIADTLGAKGRIEIHGIYPEHFQGLSLALGYDRCEPVDFRHKVKLDRYNSVRPQFFRCINRQGLPCLVVAVIPGRDYVVHYATLVRHFAYTISAEPSTDDMVRVLRYPLAENTIAEWTGLSARLVPPRTIVVLGHIPELEGLFDAAFQKIEILETNFFGVKRYQTSREVTVTLLGVKYCFWGSIAAELCLKLCQLGATEIIYLAKLGALTSPADLYSKVFCPSQFAVLSYDEIAHKSEPPPNNILRRFPLLDSGVHVSVPTVLEEDYVQRHLATQLGASSIDNEISQIARAIGVYNEMNQSRIAFSALHFATDYLRKPTERDIATQFDLSNNRKAEAKLAKIAIIERIFNSFLHPYLEESANAGI